MITDVRDGFFISCVVDGKSKFYFQAELLLHSILKTNTAKAENIIVHCTESVKESFLDFLDSLNLKYVIVTPFLDKKYCNKIIQLDYFKALHNKQNTKGVLLLDLDTFFVNKLSIPDPYVFSARIVGGANPPINDLIKIFEKAEITIPVRKTSVLIQDIPTFENNFNGGFYYIPWDNLALISNEWKKWATWLYGRQDLFENQMHRIHVDQVSMCMALEVLEIKTKRLPSNFNFPSQVRKKIKVDQDLPVYLLHYHNTLSSFGYLETNPIQNPIIQESISKANDIINSIESFKFYYEFRSSLIRFQRLNNDCTELTEILKERFSSFQKIRLLIHIGTPKTGTSSLQLCLNSKRKELRSKGFLYPIASKNEKYPKHQWVAKALKSKQPDIFKENFQTIRDQIDESIHTIILTTEGIYTQWGDFNYLSLSLLKSLCKVFEVNFLIWLREPSSFTKSYYIQCLKNPRLKNRECFGQDISVFELLENKWFQRVLDYLFVLNEIQYHFPQSELSIFEFQGNTIKQLFTHLELNIDLEKEIRENYSLQESSVSILRIINSFDLSVEEKAEAVSHLYSLDELMRPYASETHIQNEKLKAKVEWLLKFAKPQLQKSFKIDFQD